MTREQKEIIQYHLDEKLIMTIDRCFNKETSSIIGFPINDVGDVPLFTHFEVE